MKNFNFRQGILPPTQDTIPPWISLSADKTGADLISDDINTRPTMVTFAHHGSNYLIQEDSNISKAWGGNDPVLSDGVNNQSLTSVVGDKWLYWDISLNTGKRTFGWTSTAPVFSATSPLTPTVGLCWFDTVNTTMKICSATNPIRWREIVRVFTARLSGNAFYPPYLDPSSIWLGGSQVGLNTSNSVVTPQQCITGQILFSTVNGQPIRHGSSFEFVTTGSMLAIAVGNSAINVSLDSRVSFKQAVESIAKFSLVSFLPNDQMTVADDSAPNVGGAIVDNANQNDIVQVITNGIITNTDWNWADSDINAPVFRNNDGTFTTTAPTFGTLQNVGFVYDKTSVYFQLSPSIRLN